MDCQVVKSPAEGKEIMQGLGWGGGALSTPSLAQNPRTQPRRNVAGRSGGRGTPEMTPLGAGQRWRPAGDGGAEGRTGRWRRAALPTRPHLCTPPPAFSRGPSSPTTGQATGPDGLPGPRCLPDVFSSLPSHPGHTVGGDAHHPGGVRRGHRTALRTYHINDPSAGSRKEILSADVSIIQG